MLQALQGLRYQFFELQSPKTGQKVNLSNATTSIEYFEDIFIVFLTKFDIVGI